MDDLVDDIESRLRSRTEEALDGAELDFVAERRRGAMRVDIVNFVGVEFCGPERVHH